MCGICGYVSAPGQAPPDQDRLAAMCATITHRGPDDDGLVVIGPAGLGVRRLSIIDLAGGHQPISNEDQSIWIVFNGEIFNFESVRAKLIAQGHQFTTRTDTEVVVHLYEQKGIDGIQDLDGQFAFALWDGTHRRLILARDRSGEKPLFYHHSPQGLLFGSELKCLNAYQPGALAIDPTAVQKYLVHGYVPAPGSIYRGVKKLNPAEVLELRWDTWQQARRSYWRPIQQPKRAFDEINQAADALETELAGSVEAQLRSDVPLGVFLSGGIDSGVLTALMRRAVPADQIHAFTIGFADSAFSELPYAEQVARHLGIQHHTRQFPMVECRESLVELQYFCDEPIADPSILPTYLLSRFARERVTVALSGDGSDELFGGYPKYGLQMRLEPFDRLPQLARAPLARGGKAVGAAVARRRGESKASRALQMLDTPPYVRNQTWIGPVSYPLLSQLVDRNMLQPEYQLYGEALDEAAHCAGLGRLDHVLFLDQRLALQNLFLVKVDRASMATSLEVRAPYLSRAVMEFAGTLPDHLRVWRGQTKVVLRHLAYRHLPAAVIDRPKQGFGIPVRDLLRTTFRDPVQRMIASDHLERLFLTPSCTLRMLVREHLDGSKDHSAALWALLVLTLWAERWMM